tara:strand:- start:187 stop:1608 length:1422 start_codon:yes stop_codon:yes gene_type:complete
MKEISKEQGDKEKKGYPFSKWMSLFFLAVSLLMLIYTCYRAEITYQGTMGEKYFKFYIISLAGVLFWGVILRLNEEVRANIVLASISLVMGLYISEGVLSIFDTRDGRHQRLRSLFATLQGVEFDLRSIIQVVTDLRSDGVDAFPTIHGVNFIGDRKGRGEEGLYPLTGISNKTTVYNNENGKHLIYLSDRYGFNNPDAEWDSPTEWLLTGDSFAQGSAVQPGEDIAGQIRKNTSNSAISLGVGGNGPLLELANLKEYAEPIRPKKVIWLYYEGNDIDLELPIERENQFYMQYLRDGFSQGLIHKQKELDRILEEFAIRKMKSLEEIEKSEAKMLLYQTRWIRLAAIRNMLGWDVGVVKPRPEVIIDQLFSEILTKAKARTEAWGGEFYFVYLPEFNRYEGREVGNRNKAAVIDFVRGLNIPVIDIHQEVFADHPKPRSLFPFGFFGHYNADGYSKVAKAIVAGVKKIDSEEK